MNVIASGNTENYFAISELPCAPASASLNPIGSTKSTPSLGDPLEQLEKHKETK